MSNNQSQITNNQNGSTVLFIRADASSKTGTGHIMRCIALGQAWLDAARHKGEVRDQGSEVGTLKRSDCKSQAASLTPVHSVVFICAEIPGALAERLETEGFKLIRIDAGPGSPDDLTQTLNVVSLQSAIENRQSKITNPWLVLDGYHFDINYQQGIRTAGYKLLLIDDYCHLPRYEADILLNQNLNYGDFDYQINDDCVMCFGMEYTLLRREFMCFHPTRSSGVSNHLLVVMGGGDLHNFTLRVLEILDRAESPLAVKAVLGPANSHALALDQFAERSSLNLELLSNVSDMPALIDWADFAISAAGSICAEFMYMNLPGGLVVVAENQRREAVLLAQTGQFELLGDMETFREEVLLRCIDRWLGEDFQSSEINVAGRISDLIQKITRW